MLAPGERVVRERGVRANEHIIFESKAVPDLYAALDRDPVADHDIILDENMIANVAVGANDSTRQDVNERPDPSAGTNATRLDDSFRMRKKLRRFRDRQLDLLRSIN